MPIYDYECRDCGCFSELAPMARHAEPSPCPECGAPAPRVMLAAPSLASMPTARRKAYAVNERSAHEPRSTRDAEIRRRHGPGCSCCSPGTKGKTVTAADGAKAFPTRRPWMISH